MGEATMTKRREVRRSKVAARQALVQNDTSLRLAVEVLPADVVIEALSKLAGGDLFAKQCGHCGQWYCIRETDNGLVRRVEAKTAYCSARCTQRHAEKAWRERQRNK